MHPKTHVHLRSPSLVPLLQIEERVLIKAGEKGHWQTSHTDLYEPSNPHILGLCGHGVLQMSGTITDSVAASLISNHTMDDVFLSYYT